VCAHALVTTAQRHIPTLSWKAAWSWITPTSRNWCKNQESFHLPTRPPKFPFLLVARIKALVTRRLPLHATWGLSDC